MFIVEEAYEFMKFFIIIDYECTVNLTECNFFWYANCLAKNFFLQVLYKVCYYKKEGRAHSNLRSLFVELIVVELYDC